MPLPALASCHCNTSFCVYVYALCLLCPPSRLGLGRRGPPCHCLRPRRTIETRGTTRHSEASPPLPPPPPRPPPYSTKHNNQHHFSQPLHISIAPFHWLSLLTHPHSPLPLPCPSSYPSCCPSSSCSSSSSSVTTAVVTAALLTPAPVAPLPPNSRGLPTSRGNCRVSSSWSGSAG